jgi:hypothetical protein
VNAPIRLFSANAALLVLLTGVAFAADPAPISAPTLHEPLGKEWTASKGKWEVKDGILVASEIPEEHHAAVLHLATGPTNLTVECDFRFSGGKIFYVGCDAQKHVGRLIVQPKSARLAEDSTEVKGKTPSHTLAEAETDFKPGEWHHLRLDYAGDQITAKIDQTELKAQHPYLATPKVRWWFAAGGATVDLRNVRFTPVAPR